MTQQRCRYPDGDVPQDLDSVAGRLVTVTLDPEDAISILRTLGETCCPQTLRTVGEALAHG